MRWLLLIVFCPLVLFAQHSLPRPNGDPSLTFSLKKYDVADGLLHRLVTSITQDNDGFIWLANPVGVQRFDGYTFTGFTKAEGLHGEDPRLLLKDGDGLIWILYPTAGSSLASAIDILDPRTGRIQTFAQHFGEQVPVRAEELALWGQVTPDSTLLLTTEGRMIGYHARRGFSTVALKNTNHFLPLHREGTGNTIGLAGDDGWNASMLLRIGPTGATLDTLYAQQGLDASTLGLSGANSPAHARAAMAQGTYLRTVFEQDRVQELWVSPAGAVKLLADVRSMPNEARAEHRTWLGDDRWLVHATVRRMKPGDDPLSAPVLFDLAARYPELAFRIHGNLVDRAGHVWIGTEFGLYRLSIRPSRFQQLLWQESVPEGFGKRIRGLAVIGDRLHVNTEGEGYWVLDARSGQPLRTENDHALRYGLIPDGAGGVWRGVNDTVLHEDTDGRLVGPPLNVPFLAWSLLPLDDARFLVGTARGLFVSDVATGMSSPVTADAAQPPLREALQQSTVVHLARENAVESWACASNGLYLLNKDGAPVERWCSTCDDAHRLPAMDFRHVARRGDDLWIATGDGGIIRWDRLKGRVSTITRRDGLPTNSVHAVYFDRAGLLWAPTDNGLVRYDPQTRQVSVFTEADGITHNEFNRLAHTQDPDGRLYFGGLNGITIIDPFRSILRSDTLSPPLLLTRVLQYDGEAQQVVDHTIAVRNGATITLHPNDRFLRLAFALLSYEDPKNILYAWRLDDIDADWNYQHEADLRFNMLPYGEQVLRIKAQGGNGLWGAKELLVHIDVVRPFWSRWWFIVLLAAVFLGIVYLLFRYRLAKARKADAAHQHPAAEGHDREEHH